MDLAARKTPQKINKRSIHFLFLLPGLWLLLYIFVLALGGLENFNTSKDMWNIERSSKLLEEFKKYRNFFYSIYILIALFYGLVMLTSGFKKVLNRPRKTEDTSTQLGYFPYLIEGIILITFSYALAGVLIDLVLIIRLVI